MPVIRYTLAVEGETFSETDTFAPTNQPEALVNEMILLPMNSRREALGEPKAELLKVEILNPYKHLHSWYKTTTDRLNLRVYYTCERCGLVGHKPFNPSKGPIGAEVIRDPKHEKEKYAFCMDALKELPKKIQF